MVFNNTNNSLYNGYQCVGSWPSTPIQLSIYFPILVSSLAGNVLIAVVFYRDKTLRTTVNYFIVNMCISDLMFPIIILPIWIILEYDKSLLFVKGVRAVVLYETAQIAFGVSALVSLFSMTALAADRFRAIIFPMKPALMYPKKCCVTITTIWISAVSFLVYYGTESLQSIPSDYISYHNGEWITQTYFIIIWIFFALVCSSGISLTFFYFKVSVFLYRKKNSFHLASEVVKKRAKRNRKLSPCL